LLKEDFDIETRFGTIRAYQQTTNKQIHIALTKALGESISQPESILQVNNDLLGTLTKCRSTIG
jgi:3,4-dihydroxy 2-butanone 4-phosphate synthase/GTP cyclohydrolase II